MFRRTSELSTQLYFSMKPLPGAQSFSHPECPHHNLPHFWTIALYNVQFGIKTDQYLKDSLAQLFENSNLIAPISSSSKRKPAAYRRSRWAHDSVRAGYSLSTALAQRLCFTPFPLWRVVCCTGLRSLARSSALLYESGKEALSTCAAEHFSLA